jgi:3-hydroxyacyl-CoA dehydrogenase
MASIDRVAVLGAGVMGSGIAAHLANAGAKVLLLDVAPAGASGVERNRLGAAALAAMKKGKGGLYVPALARNVSIGNFDDDLPSIGSCDWVIEVVVENMSVKKALFERVAPHLGARAVLSTNTSGLSVREMATALPPEIRRRFLVTHFFNPPRQMRLVEVVPCVDTDPAVLAGMVTFIRRRLGKGVVLAKDTPNFIANRIGVYSMFDGFRHMADLGLAVEDVDAVAGPATARPGSALFRLADLVGLDTLAHIGANSIELLGGDDERQMFAPPDFLRRMVERGLLGKKAKQGFYRRVSVDGGEERYAWDVRREEYVQERRPRFDSVAKALKTEDPAARLRTVLSGTDAAAEFAWRNLRDTLIYSFKRIPEAADDVVAVDAAMRWGFNWELGPFEMMDAIGVAGFVERAAKDGVQVPAALRGVRRFYDVAGGDRTFLDLGGGGYRPAPEPAERIDLGTTRRKGGLVEEGAGASVLSLGDGVFCVEFHTKMNVLDADALAVLVRGVERASGEGAGLVVANQGKVFSAGANLRIIAADIEARAFDRIERLIAAFQRACMALKYAPVPVVAAPHAMALGGGCEICLHADAIVAHAELAMGLVELGVGLLPAGGGTKELALRAIQLADEHRTDVTPFLARSFETIFRARMSASADELREMGLLRRGDSVTIDPDALVRDARLRVLAIGANYRAPPAAGDVRAPGRAGAAALAAALQKEREAGLITEYDECLGNTVASVMTGGDVPAGALVSEEHLLGLEREAFLRCCGEPRTLARIRHMLETGKRLRN